MKDYALLVNQSVSFCPAPRPSSAEAQRMANDPSYHYQVWKATVQPLPTEYNGLAESALREASLFEARVLAELKMSHEDFSQKFHLLRRAYLENSPEVEKELHLFNPIVLGLVRNFDWVNLFAWVMPSADPSNSSQYKRSGSFIAALFYIELIWKSINSPASNTNSALARLEAVYKMAWEPSDVS